MNESRIGHARIPKKKETGIGPDGREQRLEKEDWEDEGRRVSRSSEDYDGRLGNGMNQGTSGRTPRVVNDERRIDDVEDAERDK